MYSVTAESVSLAFYSFIKIGKRLWTFLMCIILFVLKMKKNEKKRNSTQTSSNRETFVDFFNVHYLDCFKNEEKEKKINSTPTSSNNSYINDCLKYFPQEIIYKECLIFYTLQL